MQEFRALSAHQLDDRERRRPVAAFRRHRPHADRRGLSGGGNLTVGTTYFYVVTAVGPNGDESVVSDQLAVTPLSAGIQAASLTWSAPTGVGPFTYNIYRSTLAGNFTNGLVASGVTGTTFTDTSSLSTLPGTPGGLKVLGQQALCLTGSGLVNDGALRNVAGNNTWAGKITLASVPAYSTTSSPEGVVAVYVDPGNTLTLSNNINEGPPIAAPRAERADACECQRPGSRHLLLRRHRRHSQWRIAGQQPDQVHL